MSADDNVTTATPPAPWIAAQTDNLLKQRGHAWLLQGPSGLGQYELALQLVRAWLCDAPTKAGACNTCTSCHAIDVRSHTDLCVLMPETVMIELGWPLSEKAQSDIDDKKRKPSKEIRIDAMRDAVEFAQRTAGRGKGKAMLVYPAERMNHITANALLKTLEEPPGDLKFVLASEAAHQLLPTIRSRCLTHTLTWPKVDESLAWLVGQGIKKADAEPLLRAAGGRPEDALAFANSGRNPSDWQAFPKAPCQIGSPPTCWTPSKSCVTTSWPAKPALRPGFSNPLTCQRLLRHRLMLPWPHGTKRCRPQPERWNTRSTQA